MHNDIINELNMFNAYKVNKLVLKTWETIKTNINFTIFQVLSSHMPYHWLIGLSRNGFL